MKVFWLFNHPAPYKVNFFNLLGKHCEIHAVFERKTEGKRNPSFYSIQPENFEQTICKSLPLGGINNWTREPVSILRKEKFDIVVLNGWRTFTEQHTIEFCKSHKIPYIFYINGGIKAEKEAKWKRRYKERYIKGAYVYLCPDECSKDYLMYYGADEKRIFMYPYSTIFEKEILDEPYPYEKRLKLRQKAGRDFAHLFISSGQFIARKNYEFLIELWKDLPEDYGLLITGEGPLKNNYVELIEKLGLEKKVILSPYLSHDELLETFRYCDGFVFPSKEDIYGHVVNEAMSQGLPVVSSDKVNAAKRLIENDVNGYVVPIDKNEFEKSILAINEQMHAKSIKTAKMNTIEKSVDYHLEFFEKMLESLK